MLVLTLKEDEKLHIGDESTLQFTRKIDRRDLTRSKQLDVAISVPKEVKVMRAEITDHKR